jgi:hypothetical protein
MRLLLVVEAEKVSFPREKLVGTEGEVGGWKPGEEIAVSMGGATPAFRDPDRLRYGGVLEGKIVDGAAPDLPTMRAEVCRVGEVGGVATARRLGVARAVHGALPEEGILFVEVQDVGLAVYGGGHLLTPRKGFHRKPISCRRITRYGFTFDLKNIEVAIPSLF